MTDITFSDSLFVTGVIFFLIALVVILPTTLFDFYLKKKLIVQKVKQKRKN